MREDIRQAVLVALKTTKERDETRFYVRAGHVLSKSQREHIKGDFCTGGKRSKRVLVPTEELKKFHRDIRKMINLIGRVFIRHNCSIGSEIGRSRHDISNHAGLRSILLLQPSVLNKYVMIKADIRRAFNSVPLYAVDEEIQRIIHTIIDVSMKDSPERRLGTGGIARAARQAVFLSNFRKELLDSVTYKGSMPIGYPLSSMIFNRVMYSVDRRMDKCLKEILTCERQQYQSSYQNSRLLAHFRYVDDIIVISHREIAGKILSSIKAILESEGFSLSRKKTRVVPFSSGWSALGMILSDPLCRPSRKFRKKMRGISHKYKRTKDEKTHKALLGMMSSLTRKLGVRHEILRETGALEYETYNPIKRRRYKTKIRIEHIKR